MKQKKGRRGELFAEMLGAKKPSQKKPFALQLRTMRTGPNTKEITG